MNRKIFRLITLAINKKGQLGWEDSEMTQEAIQKSRWALVTCYHWGYTLSVEAFAEGFIYSGNTPIHFHQLEEYQKLIWAFIQLNPEND